MDINKLRMEALNDASAIAFAGHHVPVGCIDGEFVVQARPMETSRMRLVPNVRHSRKDDLWRMPATPAQYYTLQGVFSGRLELTEAAQAMADRFLGWQEIQEIRRAGEESPKDLSEHLFDFQRTGVQFLLGAGSALLGDQMGTGKTIQATEWMRVLDGQYGGGHHLVVSPNSMKRKWAQEIERFWPEAITFVIDGTAPKRRKEIEAGRQTEGPVVYIVNYESLVPHTKLKAWGGKTLSENQRKAKEFNDFEWTTVVLDEAHKIKGPGNNRTMAAKQMGLQAKHRLAMTGTPLVNNPDDLWSIMEFVMPSEYGSITQFRQRWCDTRTGWHGGLENLGLRPDRRQEFDQIFMPRFIRRTLKEVMPDMAEMLPVQYRFCQMDASQKKIYRTLMDELFAVIDEEVLVAPNPLALAIRLRQAASATPIINNGEVVGLGKKSCKLTALQEILEEDPGEPIVVYAESRKLLEFFEQELTESGLAVGMITGKIGTELRQKYVDAFQEGQLDVILINDAGAEGLTLTRAAKIVLAQQSWSHAINEQVIFRIWRIGQEREVLPIVLVTEDTIDEVVAVVDVDKELRLQDLVRDPNFWKEAAHGRTRQTT